MRRILPFVVLAALTAGVLAGCVAEPNESDHALVTAIPTPASDTRTVLMTAVPAEMRGELTRVVQTPAKSLEAREAKAQAKASYGVYAGCSSTRRGQRVTYTVTVGGKFEASGTIQCNRDQTEDAGDNFADGSTVQVSLGVPKQVLLAYAIVAPD
jgi:hypothetical protein